VHYYFDRNGPLAVTLGDLDRDDSEVLSRKRKFNGSNKGLSECSGLCR